MGKGDGRQPGRIAKHSIIKHQSLDGGDSDDDDAGRNIAQGNAHTIHSHNLHLMIRKYVEFI